MRVLLVFIVGVACRRAPEVADESRRQPDRSVVLSKASESYLTVEAARPVGDAPTRPLPARVEVDERNFARIGSPIAGRVVALDVLPGQEVKKGQRLARIAAPDLATFQAELAKARSRKALAAREAERMRTLAERGAGSAAEATAAETALHQAEVEERRASHALEALGGSFGDGTFDLRSPLGGVVIERSVAIGSQVSPSQERTLLAVADLSRVWIVVDVYERDLATVRVGDQAEVRVLALPDRSFSGRISHLSDVLDPMSRAAKARIELSNQDRALRPGMFAHVSVHGASRGVAEVPTSAVLARRDQFFVFVRRDDGAYVQREVQVGEQRGQHMVILSGVTPGQPVVTEGAVLLDAEANEAL